MVVATGGSAVSGVGSFAFACALTCACAGAGAAAEAAAAGDADGFMTVVLVRTRGAAGVVPGPVPRRRVGSFGRPVVGGAAGGFGAAGGVDGLARGSGGGREVPGSA